MPEAKRRQQMNRRDEKKADFVDYFIDFFHQHVWAESDKRFDYI